MQTSFFLSFLAVLCLSHQAFSLNIPIEATEVGVEALPKAEVQAPVKKCCSSCHSRPQIEVPQEPESIKFEKLKIENEPTSTTPKEGPTAAEEESTAAQEEPTVAEEEPTAAEEKQTTTKEEPTTESTK